MLRHAIMTACSLAAQLMRRLISPAGFGADMPQQGLMAPLQLLLSWFADHSADGYRLVVSNVLHRCVEDMQTVTLCLRAGCPTRAMSEGSPHTNSSGQQLQSIFGGRDMTPNSKSMQLSSGFRMVRGLLCRKICS